jgi:hypothetical protein
MKKIKFEIRYLFFLVGFFVLSFLFFQTDKVSAAELFIGSPNQTKVHAFAQGDEFLASVFLNTSGEAIDAIQADISFPSSLDLKEIRTGNSIINFWVAQPKLIQPGMVSLSGIITGGYTGTTGPIASLVFFAKAPGTGSIIFDNTSKVLLDDGKGTQAALKTSSYKFSVSKTVGAPVQSTVQPVEDVVPPEGFTPQVVQNSTMFGGMYFLVFATQDQGSGIDHYEVYETKNQTKNLTNVKWKIAESPYILQDQSLHSFIYIKAVDLSGNGRIESVGPRYHTEWYKIWWIWFIVIILIIVIIYLIQKFILKGKIWKKS